MKLILLTQYYPPEVGAPQNRLSAMAQALVERGVEVRVLTAMPNYPAMRIQKGYRGRPWMTEHIGGIEVIRAWLFVSRKRNLFFRLCNYFSFVVTALIVGLLRLKRADILMVESPPLFLGLTAMGLARAKGAKLVFNVSDLWPESAVQLGLVTDRTLINWSTRLELACYRRAALVTGQTQGIVENIRRRCPDKKVLWSPNGVDLKLIEAIGSTAVPRSTFDLPDDPWIAVYGGIIGHAQGLEVVLNAAQRTLDDPGILYLLVGDGPEREKLRAQARDHELTNVRFIDPLPRREMLTLLKACDALVVPLRKAPLFLGAIPSKIFEGVALGKPLLLGVDGEARQLFIDEGRSGTFFEPGDDAALALAVRRYAGDADLARVHGENGARYVRANFDRDHIAGQLYQALVDLGPDR